MCSFLPPGDIFPGTQPWTEFCPTAPTPRFQTPMTHGTRLQRLQPLVERRKRPNDEIFDKDRVFLYTCCSCVVPTKCLFPSIENHMDILWGAHMYMYTYNNKYCICFVVYAAVVYRSVHRNWIKSRYRHHWWYNGSGGPHEVSKIQFLLWLTAVY